MHYFLMIYSKTPKTLIFAPYKLDLSYVNILELSPYFMLLFLCKRIIIKALQSNLWVWICPLYFFFILQNVLYICIHNRTKFREWSIYLCLYAYKLVKI